MKGLIIENEYDVDESIKAMLKDNNTLFESINEQTMCEYRDIREIAQYIPNTDAIIIATTWMHQDQIEEYIDAFINGHFKDLKMKFYVHWFVRSLNDWKGKESWTHKKELRDKILTLYKSGRELFTFEECGDEKTIDEYNTLREERERNTIVVLKIEYSEEKDLFYCPGHDYYNLNSMIEEYYKPTFEKSEKNNVFFQPDETFLKWIKKYAGGRLIIDVGCGKDCWLMQQLDELNQKCMGVELFIDHEDIMKLNKKRMDNKKQMLHIFPWDISDCGNFIGKLPVEKTLVLLARPCHGTFVQNTIDVMPNGMEVLYITKPENIEKYIDLGIYENCAKLIQHKGTSKDKEIIYSIVKK